MFNNLDFTFVGKNSNLKGEFSFNSPTKIDGNIEGLVTMQNSHLLTIEINAKVSGIIKAANVEIYGQFEGEIHSDGVITIFPTGSVDGKIMSKSLEVYPGANLNIIGSTN